MNGNSSITTARTTAQLSSSERSVLMDRVVAQVGALTKASNEQHRESVQWAQRTASFQYDIQTDAWESPRTLSHAHRLAALESAETTRAASLLARLRWLLTGR